MNGDICPNCGRFNTTEADYRDDFNYCLPDGTTIKVNAEYPVISCSDCEESFSDWRGEQARTQANLNALAVALLNCHDLLRRALPTMNPATMGDTMREISEVLRK